MEQPAELPLARPAAWPLLGPPIAVTPAGRAIWSLVGLCGVVVLLVAAWLTPDPRGYGSHEALFGAWPCGFILTTGLPCPTCGMTTAFALMMHARPIDALVAQPAGAILCLGMIAACILSARIVITGLAPNVNWDRLGAVRLMLGFGVLLLAGWGFKLTHGMMTGALPGK